MTAFIASIQHCTRGSCQEIRQEEEGIKGIQIGKGRSKGSPLADEMILCIEELTGTWTQQHYR